jgi:limonene-1,2-epoxide hydrolase
VTDPVGVVRRYLDALARHDWDALAATLAQDVVRIGPYRDEYRGRDAYAAFLRTTVTALPGYELAVDRVADCGAVVTVELAETVDDGDARLRTQEAVVFDVAGGVITRVAVYLQTSEHVSR